MNRCIKTDEIPCREKAPLGCKRFWEERRFIFSLGSSAFGKGAGFSAVMGFQ
ncbi:MAG: hypothetical protein IJN80_01955 [Clostridia bacterium]|nr:hypothetical protein [Clostridia bacterium]